MNSFKVVFAIIGTLIGAGFSSGQEINIFFYSYGIKGIYGILLSSIIIGLVIYYTFKIIKKNDISSYNEFLNKLIKYGLLRKIMTSIINIFILISFYVMVAGFGAFLKQELSINEFIGSTIFACICYIVLSKNIKQILKINQLLIPILIFIVLLIGIANIKNIKLQNLENQNCIININWILKSILYSSYNSVLLIPILITIKDFVKSEKNIKYISFNVTIIIIILLIIIFFLLINIDESEKIVEIPVIAAISKIWPKIKNVYSIIILISIFTTAISLGIGFLKNTTKNEREYNMTNIVICMTSVAFSTIGFSNLINLLYPILGGLGIFQIIQIFIYQIYCKK